MMRLLILSLSLFQFVHCYTSTTYYLLKDFQAGTANFFNNFNFFTGADPTHGFVQYPPRFPPLSPRSPFCVRGVDGRYQSYAQASSSGLIWTSSGRSFFGANWWQNAPTGRKSLRLESKSSFTEVLIIADMYHVPGRSPPPRSLYSYNVSQGSDCSICGSWPAFWTANLTQWPKGGEIDMLEGVNKQVVDHYAFHTTPSCVVSGQSQTGIIETYNCDNNAPGQFSGQGCGGSADDAFATYGTEFSRQGGGVYAMDWRREGIRIWVFPRTGVPADILAGKPTITGWGKVHETAFPGLNPLFLCLFFGSLMEGRLIVAHGRLTEYGM